jgi:hypothetical protein
MKRDEQLTTEQEQAMGDRKQPTPPPDASTKPEPPPAPPANAGPCCDCCGDRQRLRNALARLVGVDGRTELEQLEVVMRVMPGPAEDVAASVDAIQALLATLPSEAKAEPRR